MDGDAAAVEKVPKSHFAPKVHDALCCELMKISDKIINILPSIEAAQPGSSSGIQVLCSLNNTIEKINLLVCHCAESSKLYLALTAEPIKLRCQRILDYFNQSLHQIKSMVPLLLASKISVILDHLRDVKFIVDPGEDEAGKALLNLLEQTGSSEDQEFQVLQFVTSRLNITSARTLLVERRSIKKLLDKFHGVDDKEEITLKYFLYLLTKYGSLIELKPGSTKYKEIAYTQDNCLSVINSESDASKGDCLHESELMKLSAMPFGANFSSDSSPINDQLFSWSDDYRRYQSFSNFSQDMYLRFLFELSRLPTLLQEKVVEQLKNILEGDEVTVCGMLSNGFPEALMLFLKKSHMLFDIPAQKCGAHIFLALMNNRRWELTSLSEQSFQLMSSFLNFGINSEALMILQKLVHHPDCVSDILASSIPLDLINYLYSGDNKYAEIVLKILSELPFHGEMRSLFLSSKFIEKLSELLSDRKLVKLCLNILHNLFDEEEASMMIADANGCITSIAAVLESDNHEEQEQAVTILLVLCTRSLRNCLLVLKEEVILSLMDISVNGNAKGKESSMKLLHVLSDIRNSDCLENPPPFTEPEFDLGSVWCGCPSAAGPEMEAKSHLGDSDATRQLSEMEKFDFRVTEFNSCVPISWHCFETALSGEAAPNGSLVENHPLENSKELQPKYKCFGFFSTKMRFPAKSQELLR